MTVVEQRADDLPCAVQGVGYHEGGLLQEGGDGEEELDELVEQRPLVTVGEDETFLDAAEQGDAGDVAQWSLYQQSEGFERVPEDESGLGVVLGLLEQLLDRGHLSTLFGDLDAIGHEDEPRAQAHGPEESEGEPDPACGELLQVQGWGMEQVEQPAIGSAL